MNTAECRRGSGKRQGVNYWLMFCRDRGVAFWWYHRMGLVERSRGLRLGAGVVARAVGRSLAPGKPCGTAGFPESRIRK